MQKAIVKKIDERRLDIQTHQIAVELIASQKQTPLVMCGSKFAMLSLYIYDRLNSVQNAFRSHVFALPWLHCKRERGKFQTLRRETLWLAVKMYVPHFCHTGIKLVPLTLSNHVKDIKIHDKTYHIITNEVICSFPTGLQLPWIDIHLCIPIHILHIPPNETIYYSYTYTIFKFILCRMLVWEVYR